MKAIFRRLLWWIKPGLTEQQIQAIYDEARTQQFIK